MGWNGSDQLRRPQAAVGESKPKKRPRHFHSLVFMPVGCLVILGIVCVAFFNCGEDRKNDQFENRISYAGKHALYDNNGRKLHRQEVADKQMPTLNSEALKDHNSIPTITSSQTVHVVKFAEEPKIFSMPVEDSLSALLTLKPGDMMAGFEPSDAYIEQLKASMTNKIVIAYDDPPEIVERKQAAIEGKKLLKEAMDRGESIKDILQNEYDTLIHWQNYRDQLVRGLNELKEKETTTAQDVEDYINASNELMKKYGVDNPLPIPLELDLHYALESEAKEIQNEQ